MRSIETKTHPNASNAVNVDFVVKPHIKYINVYQDIVGLCYKSFTFLLFIQQLSLVNPVKASYVTKRPQCLCRG